jgi:hypothetical protein
MRKLLTIINACCVIRLIGTNIMEKSLDLNHSCSPPRGKGVFYRL